ncbi:es1 protein, mitochondrial [Halocaridina rubra]|uniref:Es1 protein, mitochondrial n=1 Tax=Halocaridina rubra TaxID=373956 RepID=A0AAN8XMR4_HALRR
MRKDLGYQRLFRLEARRHHVNEYNEVRYENPEVTKRSSLFFSQNENNEEHHKTPLPPPPPTPLVRVDSVDSNGVKQDFVNYTLTLKKMLNLAKTAAKTLSTRLFSNSASLQAPTVAVVLSGSGVYDGSEIHEASAALVALTRAGATVECYAPDVSQMHTIDHTKGAPDESQSRNVMAESARISRGNIKSLDQLSSGTADAVFFPGGFGAAKNLSDFAVSGADMKVIGDVERIIKDFHSSKKPIGFCCIAPMLAAKVLGNSGVTITLGKSDDGSGKWPYAGSIEAAKALGANAVEKGVDEVLIDDANQVVTTPAFMYEGKFHEIHDGVAKAINALLGLIKN